MKNSNVNCLLFLLLLVIFSYFNRNMLYEEKITVEITDDSELLLMQKEHGEHQFDGIECAYDFYVEKKVKVWKETTIAIKFNGNRNCSKNVYIKENGGSIFRVQAYSTYEIITSYATYIGNGTYEVDVILTFPVKYTIMILFVYVNGMNTKLPEQPLLRQLTGSPFKISIHKDNTTIQPTKYCDELQSGTVAGRWVKCGGALPGLERCGAWLSSDFDFDEIIGFRWVPYSCQYHQYTNDQIRNCFARNEWDSIILAGDSHMKFRAYHWATRFYGNCHKCAKNPEKKIFEQVPRIEWLYDSQGSRLPLTFPNASFHFEKFIYPRGTRLKMSKPYGEKALQAKLYILNFGNRLLSGTYDLMLINLKLHSYGKAAQMLKETGKVVVWLNSMSLPWRTDLDSVPNVPPYRVKMLNSIADRIMRHYNIPVVDAFQISDGRIRAVSDKYFYIKKLPGNDFGGVVENTITNTIMNVLCNEQQKKKS